MEDKYLPIGTVVMLKEGTKRVMITGFCSMPKDNPDKMFDYSGCLFPEGYITSDQVALFNHDQIAEISHMGLNDEEEKRFKESLKGMLNLYNNYNNQKEPDLKEPNIEEKKDINLESSNIDTAEML